MKKLEKLIGSWKGKGIARYPTIKTVEYTEELVFSTNSHDEVLHYEQKTWILDEETGGQKPIFWECGFIIAKEEEVIWVNAQKSGRMENMVVELEALETGVLQMTATSKNFMNDPRMISSKRIFKVSEESLEYELYMNTTLVEVNDTKPHLKGRLSKEKQ